MTYLHLNTDGGSHGNPGEGAWAFCLRNNDDHQPACRSGYERYTTNNRMELRAVIEGLRHVITLQARDAVTVFTDSEYVRKGITEWIIRWKNNGWKTSAKKPVKNADLWRELDSLNEQLPTTWQWVKGHAGNALNEVCDQLVQETIADKRGVHPSVSG